MSSSEELNDTMAPDEGRPEDLPPQTIGAVDLFDREAAKAYVETIEPTWAHVYPKDRFPPTVAFMDLPGAKSAGAYRAIKLARPRGTTTIESLRYYDDNNSLGASTTEDDQLAAIIVEFFQDLWSPSVEPALSQSYIEQLSDISGMRTISSHQALMIGRPAQAAEILHI